MAAVLPQDIIRHNQQELLGSYIEGKKNDWKCQREMQIIFVGFTELQTGVAQ